MEKFAVDLDAVLDEFEFHEDQANQTELQVAPHVSGFFSPCTNEPARSSLDLIPVTTSDVENVACNEGSTESSSPALPSADTRYDEPFSISPSPSNCILENSNKSPSEATFDISTEDILSRDQEVFSDTTAVTALSPIKNSDSSINDITENFNEPIKQDHASLFDNHTEVRKDSSNLNVTKEIANDDVEHPEMVHTLQNDFIENIDKEKVGDNFISIQSEIEINKDQESLINEHVDTSVIELDFQLKTDDNKNLDKANNQQSLAEEIEAVTGDDQNSLLDQPEEDLNVMISSPSHRDSLPSMLPSSPSPQVVISSEEGSPNTNIHYDEQDDYMDMTEVEQYLKQLEHEKCEIVVDVSQESVETGARPKQKSENDQVVNDMDAQISDCNLTATSTHDDILIPESELVPTIIPELPPPYSEVDPNQSTAVAAKPNRPSSLDLEVNQDEVDDSPVSAGDPIVGAPGETPANPSGPRLGQANILDGLSEDQLMLGKVQPFWVPDSDAPSCMICSAKFTVVKRRHHCRSCGKVLCSTCCNHKHKLTYIQNKEGRVCTPCKTVLERLDRAEKDGISPSAVTSLQAGGSASSRPNPANPMEYCTRIPVSEQVAQNPGPADPPSVMVPVGVLKRNGSVADASSTGVGAGAVGGGGGASAGSRQENKSVMFSDGIRPGGDLTELDGGSEHRPLGKRPGKVRSRRMRAKGGGNGGGTFNGDVCKSRMPPTGLPYVSGKGKVEEEEIAVWFSAGTFVNFVLNNNLTVLTKKVNYAPINRPVWNFASRGLTSVGQDEVVILLEVEEDESLPPRDIFVLIQTIYEQAGAGRPLLEMGHVTVDSDYLGSNDHGGWLFIRHTFQAVSDLFMPNPPVLFGILVMRTEIPWARVFPLRLMLRLGAEYRYYPAPLVSTRYRKPVYKEIGHTIMSVLADFKNYAYTLPTIRGLVIHMSPAKTVISIPKNRHEAVGKALNNSNDPVLALGANFSMSVDSHLVAIQGEDGTYQTQAINILHKERVVTGASFVVFNGSLKSTSNLTAKSSIVEDGIMVQVLPDHMLAFRKKLQDMEDVEIGCGPVGAPTPDEIVLVKWVDEDMAINIGIKSVIDGKAMDGVPSLRIHSGPDMRSESHLIRWTELFLIKNEGARPGQERDPTRLAESVARAVGAALIPHLNNLKQENCTPLAVRITLDPENVCYEAGGDKKALASPYMNNLDSELVPLLHSSTSNLSIILELVFHILDT